MAGAETDLPVIFSFWHGPMSYLERICIASFIEKGHRFHLYAYHDFEQLPPGCELRDAADVASENEMLFYKDRLSPSIFANMLRLKLLEREAGIWADCDVYCVRPFESLGEFVFGYTSRATWRNRWRAGINNAVLRLPARSELLLDLLKVFESNDIPAGVRMWRRWQVQTRRALGQKVPLNYMPFGSTGPAPLGYYVRKLGLTHHVLAQTVFYPLEYGRAARLLEAGSEIETAIHPDTLAAHLWRSALTRRGRASVAVPRPDSFLAKEAERLGVALA